MGFRIPKILFLLEVRYVLFTSMRSSASLHVIWAKSEEEEEEGTFWGKKAFLGTIVK